jgi:orotate phosphoribosyltransferase
MSATYERTEDYSVCISDEGLRRLANDNALLAKAAKTHELVAATACGGIVVAIVLMAVKTLIGG